MEVVEAYGGRWGFDTLHAYGKQVGSRAMMEVAELVRNHAPLPSHVTLLVVLWGVRQISMAPSCAITTGLATVLTWWIIIPRTMSACGRESTTRLLCPRLYDSRPHAAVPFPGTLFCMEQYSKRFNDRARSDGAFGLPGRIGLFMPNDDDVCGVWVCVSV
jgi:hypothetical protein